MSSFGFLHELWLSPDDTGQLLPSCITYGPAGNDARNLQDPNSICVWVFWANSHIEAMQIYYDYLEYGEYKTDQKWDYEKYPESWYKEQNEYLQNL